MDTFTRSDKTIGDILDLIVNDPSDILTSSMNNIESRARIVAVLRDDAALEKLGINDSNIALVQELAYLLED